MNSQVHKKPRAGGFTIVEIMIALSLGILLSAALIQVFGSSRQIANVETALSRLQETGRFSLDAITKDLRLAGYQGCADPNDIDITILADQLQGGTLPTAGVEGFEVDANGDFNPGLAGGHEFENIQPSTAAAANIVARPGTDVVSIAYASVLDAELEEETGNSANVKVSDNPMNLSQGDFAMISDCDSAHIVEISNVTNGGGNITFAHASNVNSPHKIENPPYQEGAKLMTFENRTYFVADTGRDTAAGEDVFALYVKAFNQNPQEILEGVENLQILYGEQSAGGNIRYVPADTAGLDFSQVVSVRVGVLVQSFQQVTEQPDTRTYNLPGAAISNAGAGAHAGDNALRKTFTTTVKLRNRRQQI